MAVVSGPDAHGEEPGRELPARPVRARDTQRSGHLSLEQRHFQADAAQGTASTA